MVVDIFPNIDIPVVYVAWNYPGLSAEDMERRVVLVSERAYSTTVNGIERIESMSIPGLGILKVYFNAGHRHRRRHRADHRAEQFDPAHRAARHHAAQHDPVQRLERAGGAGHAQQQDHARAADLRLRPQLPAHPAVHHPGPVDPGALRRQAAADHRRRRPGAAQRQGLLADGRGQRAADHQRDRAGRHRAHRRARVQRQAQLQPADGRPVPGAAGRRARRA